MHRTSPSLRTLSLCLLASLVLALPGLGCSKGKKSRADGSFKELRGYLEQEVLPVAAAWQAAEARAEALAEPALSARRAVAEAEVAQQSQRWAVLLEVTPTPLPLRAPLGQLRRALVALAQAKGDARAQALDEVRRLLDDIAGRNVVPAPVPDQPYPELPALARMWRDARGVAPDPASMAQGVAPASLAPLAEALRQARPERPGDAVALGAAVALVEATDFLRTNPPSLDPRAAAAYERGELSEAQMQEIYCRALAPMAPRLAGIPALLAQVGPACAAPEACSPAAADVPQHPLARELGVLAERATACGSPQP